VKTAFTMRDGRVLARIIHLAHRFGCSYTRLDAQRNGADSGYEATIELHGPEDALRRLKVQVNKLINDDHFTINKKEPRT